MDERRRIRELVEGVNQKSHKQAWEKLARLGGKAALDDFREEMHIDLDELDEQGRLKWSDPEWLDRKSTNDTEPSAVNVTDVGGEEQGAETSLESLLEGPSEEDMARPVVSRGGEEDVAEEVEGELAVSNGAVEEDSWLQKVGQGISKAVSVCPTSGPQAVKMRLFPLCVIYFLHQPPAICLLSFMR